MTKKATCELLLNHMGYDKGKAEIILATFKQKAKKTDEEDAANEDDDDVATPRPFSEWTFAVRLSSSANSSQRWRKERKQLKKRRALLTPLQLLRQVQKDHGPMQHQQDMKQRQSSHGRRRNVDPSKGVWMPPIWTCRRGAGFRIIRLLLHHHSCKASSQRDMSGGMEEAVYREHTGLRLPLQRLPLVLFARTMQQLQKFRNGCGHGGRLKASPDAAQKPNRPSRRPSAKRSEPEYRSNSYHDIASCFLVKVNLLEELISRNGLTSRPM